VVKVHDVLVPEPKSMVQSIVNLILKLTTLWSFRRAKMILVPGDELVDVCRRTYGLQSGVLDVSYNGADVKRFTHHNRSNELRRSIGSRHIVIFSGLLSQGRGLEVLFNAASLIRERVPDLKVLITGDGPDLPHLRNLASTSGLNDCIVFTGAVHPDTFPTYLASADVGIGELQEDCTNYGSTPLKIVEYMASGCVVVTAKGAVSKGLIRDGINGLLSSSSDPNDVAKKILMVFHDKRKAKNIRKQARQTVEEKFSWDVIVSELERKIRDLVTNTGKNQQYD
jgi:glycosyltransferase involved in cell wall biosynthesis